jgi:RimJ/RimL family protein N-acetyltransferase
MAIASFLRMPPPFGSNRAQVSSAQGNGANPATAPQEGETRPFRAGGPERSGRASITGMPAAKPSLHLETDRLVLRPLSLGDLDEMATLLGDAEALTLWGDPLDRAGARSWIERNLARYEADGFGRCAVVMRETGELVGDCGLIRTVVEGTGEIELGWIVRHSHWNRGIATEAAAAWRDHAFGTLELERLVSMVSERNVASRRVAEKLGMAVEREAMWGGLPHLMYSMRRP